MKEIESGFYDGAEATDGDVIDVRESNATMTDKEIKHLSDDIDIKHLERLHEMFKRKMLRAPMLTNRLTRRRAKNKVAKKSRRRNRNR